MRCRKVETYMQKFKRKEIDELNEALLGQCEDSVEMWLEINYIRNLVFGLEK